jgi:hypothetical protein
VTQEWTANGDVMTLDQWFGRVRAGRIDVTFRAWGDPDATSTRHIPPGGRWQLARAEWAPGRSRAKARRARARRLIQRRRQRLRRLMRRTAVYAGAAVLGGQWGLSS